jgi:hypothetical protein
MSTVTKSPTSAFEYDDTVTLNTLFHRHIFINRMQHLNLACVVIKYGMDSCSLWWIKQDYDYMIKLKY